MDSCNDHAVPLGLIFVENLDRQTLGVDTDIVETRAYGGKCYSFIIILVVVDFDFQFTSGIQVVSLISGLGVKENENGLDLRGLNELID